MVVVVDLAEVLNPPARAKIPTIMIAMTNTMTVPLRTFALRFRWRSNSASRAARAAFWRARFSCLGTGGHPTGVSGGLEVVVRPGRCGGN